MDNSTESFKDHVLYPLFSNNKNMKVFFYCSESIFLNWTYEFSIWTGIFRITEGKVPWCDCLVHLPAAIWHQLFLTFLICLYCLKMSNNKYFTISLNIFIECFAFLKLRGFSWYITFYVLIIEAQVLLILSPINIRNISYPIRSFYKFEHLSGLVFLCDFVSRLSIPIFFQNDCINSMFSRALIIIFIFYIFFHFGWRYHLYWRRKIFSKYNSL